MEDTPDNRAALRHLPDPVATELLRFLRISTLHDCAGPAAEQRLAAAVALCRPPAHATAN